MLNLILKLVAVFIGEALAVWLLYRRRAALHLPWASSDLLIFYLPLAAGFVVFAAVLLPRRAPAQPSSGQMLGTLALAATGALVSFCAGMLVGANLYGT